MWSGTGEVKAEISESSTLLEHISPMFRIIKSIRIYFISDLWGIRLALHFICRDSEACNSCAGTHSRRLLFAQSVSFAQHPWCNQVLIETVIIIITYLSQSWYLALDHLIHFELVLVHSLLKWSRRKEELPD